MTDFLRSLSVSHLSLSPYHPFNVVVGQRCRMNAALKAEWCCNCPRCVPATVQDGEPRRGECDAECPGEDDGGNDERGKDWNQYALIAISIVYRDSVRWLRAVCPIRYQFGAPLHLSRYIGRVSWR